MLFISATHTWSFRLSSHAWRNDFHYSHAAPRKPHGGLVVELSSSPPKAKPKPGGKMAPFHICTSTPTCHPAGQLLSLSRQRSNRHTNGSYPPAAFCWKRLLLKGHGTTHTDATAWMWSSEGNLGVGSVLSFHHVELWDWMQVTSLAARAPATLLLHQPFR